MLKIPVMQIDLWKNANDWKHPMEHYTFRSREPFTEDRGKCMIDPDHIGGFNVSYISLDLNSSSFCCKTVPAIRNLHGDTSSVRVTCSYCGMIRFIRMSTQSEAAV